MKHQITALLAATLALVELSGCAEAVAPQAGNVSNTGDSQLAKPQQGVASPANPPAQKPRRFQPQYEGGDAWGGGGSEPSEEN